MNRNHVRVTGDITGDIYYSNTTSKEGKVTPFLRMMVVIQGSSPNPEQTPPVRVVAHGRRAEILEAFVQTGTRLLIEGHLSVRRHDNKVIVEIVCEHAEAIRYANWKRGYERIDELKAKDENQLREHNDLIDGMRNLEEEGRPNPYKETPVNREMEMAMA